MVTVQEKTSSGAGAIGETEKSAGDDKSIPAGFQVTWQADSQMASLSEVDSNRGDWRGSGQWNIP